LAIDAHDDAGHTALMLAAANGHADVVRVLLANGARRDLRDHNGQTAASLAKKAHRAEVEKLLRSS
jgi:ankyrin repeat protein